MAVKRSSGRLASAFNRFTLALVIIAAVALLFAIWNFFDNRDGNRDPTDFRMPIADPPIEPDRPDLIGQNAIGQPLHKFLYGPRRFNGQ